MARRPREDFAPKSLTARPIERTPIRTGPRTTLPHRFEVSARLESLHVVLEVTVESPGFTRVTSLRAEPVSMMGAVTSSAVRREVLIDQIVKLAVAELEEPWEEAPEWPGGWRTAKEAPGEFWIGPSYRRPPRADNVAEAARVYNKAKADGNPAPTLAVAAALHFQRSQASRLIRAARDAGMIPEAGAETIPEAAERRTPSPPAPARTMSPGDVQAHQEYIQRLAQMGIISTAHPRDAQGREMTRFDPATGGWLPPGEDGGQDSR